MNILTPPIAPPVAELLRAEWRDLLMLSFPVDPAVLERHVPTGTEPDLWDGQALVSVVGFRFVKARLWGVPVPFHQDFPEVNLRFYVRRWAEEGWRRGVVFLKEIVGRRLVAWVARAVYRERFARLPVRCRVALPVGGTGAVAYEWRHGGRWNRAAARDVTRPDPTASGSVEEFVAEHYWAYSAQPDGGTVEYRVEHPPWKVRACAAAELDCDVGRLYGDEFVMPLSRAPVSAFVAEGSPVQVDRGLRLV